MAELESTMQWKVDITQFTAAMQEAKKALQTTNSEFKLTTSTMERWSNNTAGIEAKVKQLGNTLEAEKRILDIYNKAWEEAKQTFGEASPEAERLAKQVENQQIKVNKTQVQLNKYSETLNKMQKEQAESATASEKLNKAIDEQETYLASLKKQYADAVLQYGKNSKEAKELAKQIKDLSAELKDNKTKLSEADKAADQFDRTMDDLDDSVQTASDGFTVMKGALANLVAQGISRVIQGVKDLARETFNAGASFESSMSNVAAISGATADEMDALSAKAEEMGAKTKFSASEAADAFGYMAMAGWKTEDMLNGIEGIMNLAAASGADLATTSDIVTDALTAMGYGAGDAGRLADVMAAASSNANTNVEMMGHTFQYAAPIIGALGYEMEDAAVAIGLMANAGIKGEKAGTALRSILTRLSAPPKECAEAMNALNISLTDGEGNMKQMDEVVGDLRKAFDGLSETEQTAFAKQIAGQEAMSGLLAVVRAAPEDYQKLTLAVENSAGAAEHMAEVMNDNVGGQITLLKSKIEGIMIKVFEKASGSIRKAIDTISKSLDKVDWDKFAEGAGEAAETVADFFAFVVKNGKTIVDVLKTIAVAFVTYKAVASIMGVYGAFTKLFGAIKAGQGVMQTFNTVMGMNPYALVAAGIVALTFAVGKYAQKQHEAIEAEYGLSNAQKESIERSKELKDTYLDMKNVRAEAIEGINNEYGYLNELKDEYNGLIDSNGKVKEGYEDRANFILNQLAQAMGMEVDQIREIIDENGKLGESIDQVIRKRQAEAILNTATEDYNKAIRERKTVFEDLVTAQESVSEAEGKYKKSLEQNGDVLGTYLKLVQENINLADSYYSANGDVILQQMELKSALDAANGGLDDAETAWTELNATIQNYEGLSAAIISGDVTKINEEMAKLQNGFITAENGNRESLERQVQNYQKNLDNLKIAINQGTPSVTQEMVDQAQSMVDAANAELDKLPPEASATATEAGQEFSDNLGAQSGNAQKAGNQVGTSANTGAEQGSAPMKKTGETAGDDYNSGVDSKKTDANKAGKNLGDEAKKGADSVDASSSGSHFGEGFINGIGNWISSAWNKGWELAKAAWNGLRKGQEEGSPSKLTTQSGVFFGAGYAEGITSMIKPVTSAASDMAKAAVDALGTDMSDQMRQIGAEGGNSLIDGMNSVIPNVSNAIGDLKAGVASANVGLSGTDVSGVGSFTSEGAKVQNVTFNQYNTSPKALDRLSLYRETNSLLFSAKVRLSDV